jgi:hypothetical protein
MLHESSLLVNLAPASVGSIENRPPAVQVIVHTPGDGIGIVIEP